MNPSFDILFYPELSDEELDVKQLIRKFQSCRPQERKFMLNTVDCMAEQFLAGHDTPKTEKPE